MRNNRVQRRIVVKCSRRAARPFFEKSRKTLIIVCSTGDVNGMRYTHENGSTHNRVMRQRTMADGILFQAG